MSERGRSRSRNQTGLSKARERGGRDQLATSLLNPLSPPALLLLRRCESERDDAWSHLKSSHAEELDAVRRELEHARRSEAKAMEAKIGKRKRETKVNF